MGTAEVRLHNALVLRDQHVRRWVALSDARAHSPESSFAQSVGLNASHWSQIKRGHRHIGERLARQIESLGGLPRGYLDSEHSAPTPIPPNSDFQGITDEERRASQTFIAAYRIDPDAVSNFLLSVIVNGRAHDPSAQLSPLALRGESALRKRRHP